MNVSAFGWLFLIYPSTLSIELFDFDVHNIFRLYATFHILLNIQVRHLYTKRCAVHAYTRFLYFVGICTEQYLLLNRATMIE